MTDVQIITEALGGSPLSRLLQSGGGDRWLAHAPRTAAEWRAAAESRRAEGDWEARWTALLPALNPTGAARERLARVIREGGVVVTTGQQPGLFGGPIYTWTKAVGAIAFADALERATGIPTAPIFWAATDDADFAEASSTVVARSGGAEVIRSRHAPPPGTPMSRAAQGDLSDAIRALRDAAGSAADPRPLDVAGAAYGDPASSVGDAFVTLLRALLAPLGMPVLDASHPAVHAASRATLDAARRGAPAIERALAERAAELRAAGFEPQVEDVPELSLVFVRDGDIKRRLSTSEAASGGAVAGTHTPNVLLRPVVERAILPTVGYLAGPGELAYFAQVSAVSAALGTVPPVAVPRWSATLLEPHIRALLGRYDITVADVAVPDRLEGRVARAAMSESSSTALAQLRAMIDALPAALGAEASAMKLDAAVAGGARSLQHRLARLERRIVAGIKRRETDQMRELATLRAALYPMGMRQERALNLLPLLARHGLELLPEMCRAAKAHAESLVGTH